MHSHQRAYRCKVCRWQGVAEPLDAGDAAPCPNCGSYLYPQPFGGTWGVVVLLLAATFGAIFAAVYWL